MKYKSEIEIDKPLDKVIKLFDNPDNMGKWMKGLERFEHLSGTSGQPGAKSKLTFKNGKRKLEMIETILVRNLPHEFTGTYEAKGVFNRVKNGFVALEGNRTRYITEQEFEFKGVMMKLFGALMPGMFRKKTMEHLQAFKHFAENYR